MLFMCYDVTLLRLRHRKAWRRQHVTSYQCYDECYDLNYIQNRARYRPVAWGSQMRSVCSVQWFDVCWKVFP